jgi:uncharacterized protein YutE (UPF0331/DUF86 family)
MVKKNVVAARLKRLQQYLKTLHEVKTFDIQRFKSDPFIHGTAERNLHLAIECLLDIGNHIIADRGYRKPDTYAEIIEVLAQEGVVSQKLCQHMAGMAAFRNVLVHDYVTLDLEVVYQVIQGQLQYLEELGGVFAELL